MVKAARRGGARLALLTRRATLSAIQAGFGSKDGEFVADMIKWLE